MVGSIGSDKRSRNKKKRPCIIISPNEMSSLKTAIVAPMTSKGFNFPTRIQCTFQEKKGLILLDQIRSADKSRLVKKLGVISMGRKCQEPCLLRKAEFYSIGVPLFPDLTAFAQVISPEVFF